MKLHEKFLHSAITAQLSMVNDINVAIESYVTNHESTKTHCYGDKENKPVLKELIHFFQL